MFSGQHNRAARSLDKWINILLEINSTPIIILQVKVEHLISELTVLELATINDHGLPENSSMMVFSWKDIDSFSFQYIISFFNGVVNSDLVGAFSDLSLSIKHETTTESVNLIIKWAGGV